MSGGSSPPPAPNYDAVAKASENAAKEYAQIMRDQLAWAKEQYGDNKAFTDQVKEVLADNLTFNNATAQKDRARYEDIYQPLEDDLVADAKSYASDERKERERGRSMGTVAQQFDTAGEAAKRQLESFGVDPSATRYAALDLGVRTQKAAAMAAAGNQSDLAVEDRGRALRSEAINIGKGYPGSIAQQFGTAQAGGTAGVGTQNQTFSAGSGAMTAPSAWGGLTNQANANWGRTLTDMYGAQMQGWSAQQNQSSGLGSALGGIAGAVGSFAPMFFAEGGPVPDEAEAALAPPQGAIPLAGSSVPPSMSPSGGIATDDVVAMTHGRDGLPQGPAAINVDEFIFPADAARWYGEKYLQGMIEKARAAKQNAPAQPEQGSPPGRAPQRPAALPV